MQVEVLVLKAVLPWPQKYNMKGDMRKMGSKKVERIYGFNP
jgi:hypothetical protein